MSRVIRDSCIELALRPVCIGTQLEQNRIKHSRCRGATFGQKLRLKGDPKKKTKHLNPPWVDIEADKNPALLHLFEIWIKKS